MRSQTSIPGLLRRDVRIAGVGRREVHPARADLEPLANQVAVNHRDDDVTGLGPQSC